MYSDPFASVPSSTAAATSTAKASSNVFGFSSSDPFASSTTGSATCSSSDPFASGFGDPFAAPTATKNTTTAPAGTTMKAKGDVANLLDF